MENQQERGSERIPSFFVWFVGSRQMSAGGFRRRYEIGRSGHGRGLVPSFSQPGGPTSYRRAVPGGKLMKVRFATLTAATLFAAALTMAADGSWTGWISDSQ